MENAPQLCDICNYCPAYKVWMQGEYFQNRHTKWETFYDTNGYHGVVNRNGYNDGLNICWQCEVCRILESNVEHGSMMLIELELDPRFIKAAHHFLATEYN